MSKKINLKYIYGVIIAIIIAFFGIGTVKAEAFYDPVKYPMSGCVGDNYDMRWEMVEDKNNPGMAILKIWGSGEMPDFEKNPFGWEDTIIEVQITGDVESVGNYAFAGLRFLKKVTLPDSVKRIGEGAFNNDTKLTTINIPKNLETIGNWAFRNTSVSKVALPDSVTSVGREALSGINLKELTGGKNLTDIGDRAFADNKNLVIKCYPNSVLYEYAEATEANYELIEVPNIKITLDVNGGDTIKKNVLSAPSGCRCGIDVIPTGSEFCSFDGWYTESEGGEKVTKTTVFSEDTTIYAHWIAHTNEETLEQATPTDNGLIKVKCSVCGHEEDTVIYAIKEVKLSKDTYTYSGKNALPSVKVYDMEGKLISSDFYDVEKPEESKAIGEYSYKITFKDNYYGEMVETYKVIPKATKITSIVGGKKNFTVKWSKQTKQTTGYQIRYSLKSDMSKSKTVTVKSNTVLSKVVKSLKSKKTYYVQVRTYSLVDEVKYYSAWSTAKKVKTN